MPPWHYPPPPSLTRLRNSLALAPGRQLSSSLATRKGSSPQAAGLYLSLT